MHFRVRDRVIQVVRTTYDPATKRARAQIVGKMLRTKPEIGKDLVEACTPPELEEVRRWVDNEARLQALMMEVEVRAFAGKMQDVASWLSERRGDPDMRAIVQAIAFSIPILRRAVAAVDTAQESPVDASAS